MNAIRRGARSTNPVLGFAISLFVLSNAATAMSAQSARVPATTKTSSSGGPMLVGALTRLDLDSAPFSEWFSTRFAEYAPSGKVVDELRTRLADVSIEVYFGTWCGDSRRQVPRLLRILSDAQVDENRLSLYGLSDLPLEFKQAPGRIEAKRRIHRTPTIVLVRDGREIGRIVETPEETLEVDLLTLAKGQGPAPKYGAEARVHDLFVDTPSNDFEKTLNAAADEIRTRSSPDTLWHYAEFDLLRNGRADAARAVLELHLKNYPTSVQGHVLMAEALNALGRKPDALAAVERALSLEPKNARALRLATSLRSTQEPDSLMADLRTPAAGRPSPPASTERRAVD